MMEILGDLQRWYSSQCDGVWEHRYGIHIQSCDNPGWWVKIDLVGTGLETRPFTRVRENCDDAGHPQSDRWLHCWVQDDVWNGAGDETKLGLVLKLFLEWAVVAS